MLSPLTTICGTLKELGWLELNSHGPDVSWAIVFNPLVELYLYSAIGALLMCSKVAHIISGCPAVLPTTCIPTKANFAVFSGCEVGVNVVDHCCVVDQRTILRLQHATVRLSLLDFDQLARQRYVHR